MDKQYKHIEHEGRIYDLWEKNDSFSPSKNPDAEPYTIIMPPPNANDPLHVGHAMFVSVEDILTRYHRMKGRAALWLPGTDHAGIETQFVFEKKLKKQGKSRFNYDRETLYKMIWDYVQENSDIAVKQLKKIGASADWDRFKFMLEPEIVDIVLETFEQLNKDGLVYRAEKLVNYCTKCGTAFSELEVNHVERKSPLYYMKYGPFTLATTRPETKFGDTAVAVNPEDERYQKWIGKEIEVEGLDDHTFKLKVIADDYVDPEFGTGVVKITPAHDFNDFEVWQRHKDKIPGIKQVIDYDGHLTELAGKYAGQYLLKARKNVVNDLKKQGLMVKIDENYTHNMGTCYRCGTVIEPLPLAQFFIKVNDENNSLVGKVLDALEKGEVRVHGAGHDKILKHWLNNLRDWNVSRQIVWGIRMPVWYEASSKLTASFINSNKKLVNGNVDELLDTYSVDEIKTGLQTLQASIDAEYVISEESPGKNYIQETDTFDTWFSSAQWPFTTLMTGKEGDFEKFYPTQVMETGYDILPFWVMRMLMMGLYKTNKVPFKDVYLHGLVRDEKGKKMSKSKGNVINPLEVIEKYGADALRMALVMSTSAGKDSTTGDSKIRGMRNLGNKIWNAARFALANQKLEARSKNQECEEDKNFYEKLNKVVSEVSSHIDNYRIGLAAEVVYNEFWHWYCDECIEKTKEGVLSQTSLLKGLVTFLKLLHPFVPFVTEAVWQELVEKDLVDEKLLISAKWPELSK